MGFSLIFGSVYYKGRKRHNVLIDQSSKHNKVCVCERGHRALLCFLGNVEGTEEIPVCHHFRQCGTNKKKKNTHSHGRVFGEDENPREERKRRWDNPP